LYTSQPAQLLVVASDHEVVATGLNRATQREQQVSLPRGHFDDSKVSETQRQQYCSF